MATRRVSFAPEATLHTWNVVEIPEDSTTSSNSTNSTRRASNLTGNTKSSFDAPQSPDPASDASEPPSTPPEQVEELQVAASPAHQRDLHKKQRRRSSAIPPMNFNDPNDFSSSPASIVSEDTGPQSMDTVDADIDSSDSDDKDLEEEETVQVDGEDSTTQSAGFNSTSSSGRLDAALAEAAKQAGTQGIDFDENGDQTMEMADDEVTNAFQPWIAGAKQLIPPSNPRPAFEDQENVNPFLTNDRVRISRDAEEQSDVGEGTMEMTRAIGGMLPSDATNASSKRTKRKSIAGNRRRSSVMPVATFGDGNTSEEDDDAMDLTMAVGGIQEDVGSDQHNGHEGDEDDFGMTMEMTSVVGGGVLSIKDRQLTSKMDFQQPEPKDSTASGEDMDVTLAGGNILAPITEITEPIEGDSLSFTAAMGGFMPPSDAKEDAKKVMEEEVNIGQFAVSPFGNRSPRKAMGAGLNDERPLPALANKAVTTTDTGSPSLNAHSVRRSARTSLAPRQSTTPRSTPIKKPNTPSKQVTPLAERPTTPGKTPPSKKVTMRSASPKTLFKKEIKAEAKRSEMTPRSQLSESKFENPLFKTNVVTGTMTPKILLPPSRRRSSGIGADRDGLGSPKVTDLLDRRGSLGENARAFVPQARIGASVQFEDPQIMEREIEEDRKEDERRESGRFQLEKEANSHEGVDSQEVTANLKDMIGSLTPQKKKSKLGGRKSLHVGAAKGLLGKRPAELDEDSDEEDMTKRLKGREGSPVKKIKLPAPPAKNEMTGRLTRSARRSLEAIDGNAQISTPTHQHAPEKVSTTPKDQPRFKSVPSDSPGKLRSLVEKIEGPVITAEPLEEDEQPIHLQDFLNLTNIRFIELNTTKRRHTVVPGNGNDHTGRLNGAEAGSDEERKSELENCVVAGTCTVPMLELYQHSCRELKNYISEGRSIVREIETDTFEDNPPLFKEYVSAPPNVKIVMDNQFKNVKANARFLSKVMWYEWRMKLLDGLKEGLLKIGGDMQRDHENLSQQLLQPVLPSLIEEHDRLEEEATAAQAQADELAGCDQEELQSTREALDAIENELEEKQQLVEDLQNDLRQKEDRLESALSRKQQYTEDIAHAEKTIQDCRGWTIADLEALQGMIRMSYQSHC